MILTIQQLPNKGAYVAAWKRVLAAEPATIFKVDWCTTRTAAEMRQEFSKALNCRINLRVQQPQWRKLADEYTVRLSRDAQRLKQIRQRIRVYQFETVEVRRRFSHLLSNDEE